MPTTTKTTAKPAARKAPASKAAPAKQVTPRPKSTTGRKPSAAANRAARSKDKVDANKAKVDAINSSRSSTRAAGPRVIEEKAPNAVVEAPVLTVAEQAERLVRAKEQHTALAAWKKSGGKGTAPATPDLDQLAAEQAVGVKPRRPGKTKSNTNGGTRSRGERGAQAVARSKELKNKRGAGTKISDDDLAAYIVKVHAAHPASSCSDEQQYAYWIEGYAVGVPRFKLAWEQVLGS